jgi:type I restriction enzyme S subunit
MSKPNRICEDLRLHAPSDWTVVPLPDVTDFQEGPGILAKDFRDSGIPLLRLRNIEGTQVKLDGCNYLDRQRVAEKWAHFALKEGDFLISTSATLGRVSVVGPDAAGSIAYTGIIRFRSSSPSLDHSFLRAFLSSSTFVEQAQRMATGSVIKHFGPTHLKQMGIMLPRLDEQVRIAVIFDALDERINLLRQTNVTLESIAQALFKSWFVDFAPVRAKQGGHEPEGMAPEAAALFPNGFEKTEGGIVPEGWKVASLDSIANYLNGLALQKFPPEGDGSLPVIKIAQLRAGNSDGADRASKNLKPDYVVEDGDVLFSWSGSLEAAIWCGGRGALNQHLFKVTSREFPKWFYYFWTKHHLPSFQQIAASKATTMGHIQRKHLTEAKVSVPPHAVLHAASRYLDPLLNRWISNELQARCLTELRETLLPRLISGQLRLPEAEEQLGDALTGT